MSHVTRKPVFGVCDQVRLKPACSAIKTSWRLDIFYIETTDITLSKQRITKALIRLFAYGISSFPHDAANMLLMGKTGNTDFFISFDLN